MLCCSFNSPYLSRWSQCDFFFFFFLNQIMQPQADDTRGNFLSNVAWALPLRMGNKFQSGYFRLFLGPGSHLVARFPATLLKVALSIISLNNILTILHCQHTGAQYQWHFWQVWDQEHSQQDHAVRERSGHQRGHGHVPVPGHQWNRIS